MLQGSEWPVLGPGTSTPSRAMMLTLSEELFDHLRDAIVAERDGIASLGGDQPPPALELDILKQQSVNERSPGSLYIGGRALKLTGIPERIFDLYTQPHTPARSTAPNSHPLRLHAIVSQSLKVPLSLSDNLVDKIHNRTANEEKERLKRGLVRIDAPVSQPGAKKRKLSPARAGGVLAGGAARPATPTVAHSATASRPTPPVVKTLAGPPLSAQSLASKQKRKQQPASAASASASDSSSSSSQPLSHNHTQPSAPSPHASSRPGSTVPSPAKASFPPNVQSQPPSKPNSSASNPTTYPPSSDTLNREPTDGWKTSSFKGGVRNKANVISTTPNAAKAKSAASSGTTSSATAASAKSRPNKPSPLATQNDRDRDDFPDSRNAVASSSSSSRRNESPLPRTNGVKRSREMSDVDDELMAAAAPEEASNKRAKQIARRDAAPGRSSGGPYGVEAELLDAAGAAAPVKARKGDASRANGALAADRPGRKSRPSNVDVDEDLLALEAAAVRPSAHARSSSNTSAAVAGAGRPRVGSAKPSYDEQEYTGRQGPKPTAKKSTAAASRATAAAADSTLATPLIAGNMKARKSAVSGSGRDGRESPAPRVSSNLNSTTTKSKAGRASAPSDLISTMVGNGSDNNIRVNTRVISQPVSRASPANGSSRASSKAGHINGNGTSSAPTNGSRLKKRTSPIYSDDSDDDIQVKHIPIPTKRKPVVPPTTNGNGPGPIPPSPVSQTASSRTTSKPAPTPVLQVNGNANGATDSARSSQPKKKNNSKRDRDAEEDRSIDTLLSSPLPQPNDREALREHYESCYVTYITLWGRLRSETRKQEALLRKRISRRGQGDEEEGEVSVQSDSDDGDEDASESDVDVQALNGRYRKLHDRLQTIRDTLGV